MLFRPCHSLCCATLFLYWRSICVCTRCTVALFSVCNRFLQVPTGEMPRNVLLSAERFLVDNASPGTRVAVMGIYSIFNSKGMNKSVGASNVRQPYIRIVGLRVLQDGSGRSNASFTPEEEEKFAALARDPNIYERMWSSVCPSISGDYTIDIKKAVCCLLFGGSRRILPDGMKLRGDINILLLGDPSTAKSQFLKFVEKVAPVGVYTSGKGSSAAGLTASVIRDAKGEFYLEGGAMVLADGGVCCIDEFDKMREQDRYDKLLVGGVLVGGVGRWCWLVLGARLYGRRGLTLVGCFDC